MTRILLIGHGRMGRLVEALSPAYDAKVVGVIDGQSGRRAITDGEFGSVDVAIDFSVATALLTNLPQLATKGINVVIGTSGWGEHENALRTIARTTGIGVLTAENFSIGMNLFQYLLEHAARLIGPQPDFGAYLHEAHHSKTKETPAPTAIVMKKAMEQAGYPRTIDLSSTRAGAMPGIHTVGFDGVSETIELSHTIRDRAVYARGALVASKWLVGKHGWFTMRDMLGGQ